MQIQTKPGPTQPSTHDAPRRGEIDQRISETPQPRVQPASERILNRESALDATLDASFPASDPPSWTL